MKKIAKKVSQLKYCHIECIPITVSIWAVVIFAFLWMPNIRSGKVSYEEFYCGCIAISAWSVVSIVVQRSLRYHMLGNTATITAPGLKEHVRFSHGENIIDVIEALRTESVEFEAIFQETGEKITEITNWLPNRVTHEVYDLPNVIYIHNHPGEENLCFSSPDIISMMKFGIPSCEVVVCRDYLYILKDNRTYGSASVKVGMRFAIYLLTKAVHMLTVCAYVYFSPFDLDRRSSIAFTRIMARIFKLDFVIARFNHDSTVSICNADLREMSR